MKFEIDFIIKCNFIMKFEIDFIIKCNFYYEMRFYYKDFIIKWKI